MLHCWTVYMLQTSQLYFWETIKAKMLACTTRATLLTLHLALQGMPSNPSPSEREKHEAGRSVHLNLQVFLQRERTWKERLPGLYEGVTVSIQ